SGALRLADGLSDGAVEAEGRDGVGARKELVAVDVVTHGRLVGLPAALAPVRATDVDGLLVDAVFQDRVDVDEVDAVRDVEAGTVGRPAVRAELATERLGSGIVAECERAAPALQEVVAAGEHVRIARAVRGRPELLWILQHVAQEIGRPAL